MKIKYFWKRDGDCCVPISSSNFFNQDSISLLDCVLMDSGGLGFLETIPWLNEGIKRVKSVAKDEVEVSDWSRETWGVEFRKDTAKIYSLHDEEYFQTLSLNGFSIALQEWIAFLQSKPDDREMEERNFSVDT